MSVKKVYKSRQPYVSYVTKKGVTLSFIEGRFLTDKPGEIAELEDEIKSGHPLLYIDPNETEVDTTLQEKIAEAQKEAALKVIAEHNSKKSPEELAAEAAAMDAAQKKSLQAMQSGATKFEPGAGTAGMRGETPTPTVVAQTATPAQLLGVTTSAALGSLASPSNSK